MLIVDGIFIIAIVIVMSVFAMGLFKPIFFRWLEYHERREARRHAAMMAKDADELVKLLMLEPELAKDVARKIAASTNKTNQVTS